MKKYSKKELKEIFIHLLTGSFSAENQKYIENKKNIDSLFSDFVNLSKSSISVLDENQTYILRKKYGVLDNGVSKTFQELGSEFNLSSERMKQIVSRIVVKLIGSLCEKNATNILQDYCDNHLISNLLDCNIIYIFNDQIVKKICQQYNDEMTLRELVNKNSVEVRNINGLNQNEYDEIQKVLSSLNLSFKDTISIVKHKISAEDIKKDLVYKLEVDKQYYSVIDDIVNELNNLCLRSILGFDEQKTSILRKVYGVFDNGYKPSIDGICCFIGKQEYSDGCKLVSDAFDELNRMYKCYIFADSIKFSKSQQLNLDIKYYNLDVDTYINLRKSGIKTLEKLLELGHNKIECKYNYDKKLIESLTYRLDYIYELNDKKVK